MCDFFNILDDAEINQHLDLIENMMNLTEDAVVQTEGVGQLNWSVPSTLPELRTEDLLGEIIDLTEDHVDDINSTVTDQEGVVLRTENLVGEIGDNFLTTDDYVDGIDSTVHHEHLQQTYPVYPLQTPYQLLQPICPYCNAPGPMYLAPFIIPPIQPQYLHQQDTVEDLSLHTREWMDHIANEVSFDNEENSSDNSDFLELYSHNLGTL